MSMVVMEGKRGIDLKQTFADAMAEMDNCDGVVILMQRKNGGVTWFAPGDMALQTMVFYLWSALSQFGLMAAGKI